MNKYPPKGPSVNVCCYCCQILNHVIHYGVCAAVVWVGAVVVVGAAVVVVVGGATVVVVGAAVFVA